jgi:hypothetical protein
VEELIMLGDDTTANITVSRNEAAAMAAALGLGRVDGFDQDEGAGEVDDGGVAVCGLVAA